MSDLVLAQIGLGLIGQTVISRFSSSANAGSAITASASSTGP